MRWFLIWALLFSVAATARAELTPDEVGIIAMATSPESRRLAEHYADARGVPKSQILLLEGKPEVVLDRSQWEQIVRPAIRNWLQQNGLERKIRCLVTSWDVPLKIGRRSPEAPVVVARKRQLMVERKNRVRQLVSLMKLLDSLANEGKPPVERTLTADASIKDLTAAFDAALKAAQQRLQGLKSQDEKKKASVIFEKLFVAGGGTNALMRLVGRQPDASKRTPEQTARLALLQGRLQGVQHGVQALAALPDSVPRDIQTLNLIQQTNGTIGTIQWIDQQRQLLEKNETYSSFDSELSLLHWPDYPTFRWQPNPLYYKFDNVLGKRPTLMVCRLAAPTIQLAENLVDAAVAVEKTGLSGKVYLDARGMTYDSKSNERGSYGQYDQSIRDLAERLKKHTKLEVILDNEAGLFQPGDCPDAALYCGWYSLGKYIDAFDWKHGAVGYHLASIEAERLRAPGNKVWCNAMLEDGICATLGPVYEPYLSSFPLPDDFFSLLLTGRYALVEVYYRTKPFNSWTMVLVGDPLYNPFKDKPLLDIAALPDRLQTKNPVENQ